MNDSVVEGVDGSRPARLIHRLAVPILLAWIAIAVVTNIAAPQLEVVGEAHSVSMNSPDAPSMKAMNHIGKVFDEFDSDSSAMIVLEGDKPLDEAAHRYYDAIVKALSEDQEHVKHIQDFWGDPLTAGGAQSKDGKAAYVQLYLSGNQGESLSDESVTAVRHVVASTLAPAGVKAYVTGASPLLTDQFSSGNGSTGKVLIITLLVIIGMLLVVYRSVITAAIVLAVVAVELVTARGVVATLANAGVIGLSTYATNLLTLIAIAAGTDYAIFVVGRYHEERGAGADRRPAFYAMYRGTIHVIVGSGLTVAGAVFCLTFARMPYFQSLGVPAAVGMLVTLAAAITLGPATLVIASRFGLMEPRRNVRTRGWRRIGTSVVRWPGPILVASCVVALIGLLALPAYETSYDGRPYMPATTPANLGYAAAERHFSQSRLNPEMLMIETDHDMRNSADMLILERIAKTVLHTPGIASVQSVTRPLGTPISHSSIPSLLSSQSASQVMNLSYQLARGEDLLKQANETRNGIEVLQQQLALQQQSAAAQREQGQAFHDTVATVNDLRDKIANFDDFFRPLRAYFYWEPHCFDIPACAALRSVFDAIDGISALADQFGAITASLDKMNVLQPQLVALLIPQIESQKKSLDLTLANYATTTGINTQNQNTIHNATALGQAYDAAKNDDSFYLPPEVFDNPDFKRGMKLFLSPDGKAARMIIIHQGDPATPEGLAHVDAIREAAFDAIKATPLSDAKIYVAGTASAYKDIREGANYDLMIAGMAALGLILLIMMFITRSLIAALVIVGTVVLSLGASFGLSVLVWQHFVGIPLFWIVLPLAVIILLAVGSDYNLLLISRFKEEISAGLKTGTIRAMASTGGVVTAAGLVFAATMATFAFSNLIGLAQVGTTIALGLLFDTLIIRAFMTPAIATLLGRWFWWPLNVRTRPASQMLRPFGARLAVRQLLQHEAQDPD